MTGTLISLLLIMPPDIITVADITPDDSDPLNVDDSKAIIATVEYNKNSIYTVFIHKNAYIYIHTHTHTHIYIYIYIMRIIIMYAVVNIVI